MVKSWLTFLTYYLGCAPLFASSSSPSSKEQGQDDLKSDMEKRRPQGWKSMPYIIGNETFEKVASMGLLANFTVYLVKEFKMQQVAAANLANIFFGTTNFAPLLGAFVSDAYWGRFRTLAYSIASFLILQHPRGKRGIEELNYQGIFGGLGEDYPKINLEPSRWGQSSKREGTLHLDVYKAPSRDPYIPEEELSRDETGGQRYNRGSMIWPRKRGFGRGSAAFSWIYGWILATIPPVSCSPSLCSL